MAEQCAGPVYLPSTSDAVRQEHTWPIYAHESTNRYPVVVSVPEGAA
jgi:hypothetical protein